ncbi:MAG: beta-ketoacyl-[acyl-carrier-protein] synthase family protein [Pirellulales bacterium]
MANSSQQRVVITGLGQIGPFGNSIDGLWEALSAGKNGVTELQSLPTDALPTRYAAEAREFTGHINEFGPLNKDQKRSIRKNLKVMCREIQMGVATAQLALSHAGLTIGDYDPERAGVVYGSDYMMTLPEEYSLGVSSCFDENGKFDYEKWAEVGLPNVTPLWLLKYLPNMPASHIAIFNDMRGPNNSLTLRESSSYAAIGEAYMTIARGHADLILTGATGTRVHQMRSVHTVMQEKVAQGNENESSISRPFDKNRNGMLLGEGAGSLILESLEHAEKRGAKIYGEIVGHGISAVVHRDGTPGRSQALANSMNQAITEAKMDASEVGHVNAHGLSSVEVDKEEADAIHQVFGDRGSKVPVVAPKSNFGNLGAAGGTVELISSVLALDNGKYFPNLHYQTPDSDCDLAIQIEAADIDGNSFLCSNVTPQGQAASILVRGL